MKNKISKIWSSYSSSSRRPNSHPPNLINKTTLNSNKPIYKKIKLNNHKLMISSI